MFVRISLNISQPQATFPAPRKKGKKEAEKNDQRERGGGEKEFTKISF